MISLKQAMYYLNIGVTPEQLVKEFDLCEGEAGELLSQASSLFEQVVYMAEVECRAKAWGLRMG